MMGAYYGEMVECCVMGKLVGECDGGKVYAWIEDRTRMEY